MNCCSYLHLKIISTTSWILLCGLSELFFLVLAINSRFQLVEVLTKQEKQRIGIWVDQEKIQNRFISLVTPLDIGEIAHETRNGDLLLQFQLLFHELQGNIYLVFIKLHWADIVLVCRNSWCCSLHELYNLISEWG